MEKGNYISISNSGAKLSVSVIVFKENDVYIAYCPSLDLSGYDHTEEAAKRDLEYVLRQWLTEQMENNTLHDDLRQHGWKLKGGTAKEPSRQGLVGSEMCIRDRRQHGWKLKGGTAKEPSLIDILRGNKSADRVFSMSEYSKLNVRTEIPCCQ